MHQHQTYMYFVLLKPVVLRAILTCNLVIRFGVVSKILNAQAHVDLFLGKSLAVSLFENHRETTDVKFGEVMESEILYSSYHDRLRFFIVFYLHRVIFA